MAKLANSWVNCIGSLLGGDSKEMDAGPDLSRRMMLTGAVAAIACGGLLVAGISTPATAAEVAVDEGELILAEHGRRRSRGGNNDHNDDNDGHSRRRSHNNDDHDDGHSRWRSRHNDDHDDGHSRRRSRRQHSRYRSESHGRRRSRRQFRGWNENCFISPVGWVCF